MPSNTLTFWDEWLLDAIAELAEQEAIRRRELRERKRARLRRHQRQGAKKRAIESVRFLREAGCPARLARITGLDGRRWYWYADEGGKRSGNPKPI